MVKLQVLHQICKCRIKCKCYINSDCQDGATPHKLQVYSIPSTPRPCTHLCVLDVLVRCCDEVVIAPLPRFALCLLAFSLLVDELQLMCNDLEKRQYVTRQYSVLNIKDCVTQANRPVQLEEEQAACQTQVG